MQKSYYRYIFGDFFICAFIFFFKFQHAFFQGDMIKRLALELLQKVNNPSHMFTDLEADEDGVSD